MDTRTVVNRILARPLPRNPGPRDLANLLVEAAEAGYAAAMTNTLIAETVATEAIVRLRRAPPKPNPFKRY
jgi:hypothetical protein